MKTTIAEQNYLCFLCRGIIHKGTPHVAQDGACDIRIHARCLLCNGCALPRFEVCAECFKANVNEPRAHRWGRFCGKWFARAAIAMLGLGIAATLVAIVRYVMR